jgi:BirA family biotin operon repressor/biotin-[acetyl-CoA-carboxylase] ligase
MVDGCKLSGILVDVSGEAGGPATAVIGVGVNVRMPIEHGVQIEQPWTDLSRISAVPISRNDLAGIIVDRLIGACRLFAEQRLAPFLGRWERFDKLHGEDVLLIRGDRVICGVYRGISPSGAMLLENAGGVSEHFAGEVSLRMVANA